MSASELRVGDRITIRGKAYCVKVEGGEAVLRPFDPTPQPEVVRMALQVGVIGRADSPARRVIPIARFEHDRGFEANSHTWGTCKDGEEIIIPRIEITIDRSTGRVVADEPWVEKAEAQLQNMHRHVDDLTNDQIRQAIEAVVGMFPAPREAEDNKQQCRLPRDLEPTDPQWLRRAVAGGEAWASDPDLDDITLPSDEQLKEWGVKVVGFRVTRPGDRYLWGNALRVDTSVCEGACKRLIVADAEADAESDDTAARVEQCARDLVNMIDVHRKVYGREKQHYVIDEGPEWRAMRKALGMPAAQEDADDR